MHAESTTVVDLWSFLKMERDAQFAARLAASAASGWSSPTERRTAAVVANQTAADILAKLAAMGDALPALRARAAHLKAEASRIANVTHAVVCKLDEAVAAPVFRLDPLGRLFVSSLSGAARAAEECSVLLVAARAGDQLAAVTAASTSRRVVADLSKAFERLKGANYPGLMEITIARMAAEKAGRDAAQIRRKSLPVYRSKLAHVPRAMRQPLPMNEAA